jgi:hypothetical protein
MRATTKSRARAIMAPLTPSISGLLSSCAQPGYGSATADGVGDGVDMFPGGRVAPAADPAWPAAASSPVGYSSGVRDRCFVDVHDAV